MGDLEGLAGGVESGGGLDPHHVMARGEQPVPNVDDVVTGKRASTNRIPGVEFILERSFSIFPKASDAPTPGVPGRLASF